MKITEAINFFGNRAKLAAALNISRTAVYQWKSKIPIRRQYEIEKMTKGELKSDFHLHIEKQIGENDAS